MFAVTKDETVNADSKSRDMLLEDLALSSRTLNRLKGEGVSTVAQLADRTEVDLTDIPNFGTKSIAEVKSALHSLGLSLQRSDSPGIDTEKDDDPGTGPGTDIKDTNVLLRVPGTLYRGLSQKLSYISKLTGIPDGSVRHRVYLTFTSVLTKHAAPYRWLEFADENAARLMTLPEGPDLDAAVAEFVKAYEDALWDEITQGRADIEADNARQASLERQARARQARAQKGR